MTWIAPEATRMDEPFTGPERDILDGFLNWYRETLLAKCAGLTGEQLAERAVPPSSLSLLGLVRHMADTERAWFRIGFHGEELPRLYDHADAAFEQADPAGAEEDFATYDAEVALASTAVVGASLDEEFACDQRGKVSLRWVFTHMIEEYARHCGHADLLRERIDGATGS
ncbi:MAG: DinB family protein [Nocardiopsaceae bacterium]|nr:DinB family protein [Nocardiopsaceae bacterium]